MAGWVDGRTDGLTDEWFYDRLTELIDIACRDNLSLSVYICVDAACLVSNKTKQVLLASKFAKGLKLKQLFHNGSEFLFNGTLRVIS